jgi:nucleotide-binding universal stress UspA family protein
MQKILIAIDYAPSAKKIAEQGYALGKSMHAEIALLHVIEDIGYYSSTVYDPIMGFGGFTNTAFLNKDVLKSIENKAEEFLVKTKKHLKDDKIQTIVVHGDVADSILEIAKKEHCDLIVIGTNARSGVEEFFLGSTVHKLIKHSTQPIYTIPTKSK